MPSMMEVVQQGPPQEPQEQQGPPQEQQGPQGPPQEGQQGEPEISDDDKKGFEVYAGAISKMLHGPQKQSVYKTLADGPPDMTIPQVAWSVNQIMFKKADEAGNKPPIDILFAGIAFATSECVGIGNAGGFWKEELKEDEVKVILEKALQKGVEEGVRGKLVDPIELQAKVNQIMPEKQKQIGLKVGQQMGVPERPGTSHAMEAYAQQAREDERIKVSSQMQQAKGGPQ